MPPLVAESQYLATTRFSQSTYRRYRNSEGESVDLFIGVNDRVRRFTSLRSKKTETLAAGSRVVERASLPMSSFGASPEELLVVDARGGRSLVVHAYEGLSNLVLETLRAAFALDRGPWRRREPSRVARLGTPVGYGEDAREQARARLVEFSEALPR